MQKKIWRRVIISILSFLVVFVIYSWFFRTYLEPMQYLDIAWENVEYDPYISNWQDPKFDLLWDGLRPVVHFTFYLDRTSNRKEIVVEIDPFTKQVLVDGQTSSN